MPTCQTFFADNKSIKIYIIAIYGSEGTLEIMKRKKSKYKHVIINKKRYYFYKIQWIDITGDAGHATASEFDKFECSKMITFAYVYKKTEKFIWTFSSYDTKDEVFSDRNVMPVGCILKLEKKDV